MDDEGRHANATEIPRAIAAGGDGEALAAGAVGVAVVSGILAASDVTAAARAYSTAGG